MSPFEYALAQEDRRLAVVINRPTDSTILGSRVFIGPTSGPGIWTLESPSFVSSAPAAPSLRRERVQKPFQKPQRLTSASDIAVHVPRVFEMLGRHDPRDDTKDRNRPG